MAGASDEQLIHATAIAIGDDCVLIRGASGTGKSDLALRCLMLGAGSLWAAPPKLIADDQVVVRREGPILLARPPATIAGLLEVRGLGLMRLPYQAEARVRLVADLVTADRVERLPPAERGQVLLGATVAHLALAPFEASAAAKLMLALARETGDVSFFA